MLLRIQQPLNGSEIDLTAGVTIGRDGCWWLPHCHAYAPEVARSLIAQIERATAAIAAPSAHVAPQPATP